MLLKSFSKINLTLSVNRKLKKKELHDLQSYFCLINLFDLIEIKKIKGTRDKVRFKGKFSHYVKIKNNSIVDTLKILRENKIITNYYSITINKQIPVYAGLGGGTSNAACIVKYFCKNKVNKKILTTLEKKIGSDLRLFFYNQGFLKSLKIINNFKRKFKLYFLLVYPNIKCSTQHIFSEIIKYSPKSKQSLDKLKSTNSLVEVLLKKKNDLQSIVEKKYPIIRILIKEIGQKKGCYFSRMTGSGSVCYGVFKSEKTAKAALNRINLKHPNFWTIVAKTI